MPLGHGGDIRRASAKKAADNYTVSIVRIVIRFLTFIQRVNHYKGPIIITMDGLILLRLLTICIL
jgi:hypothetical protein